MTRFFIGADELGQSEEIDFAEFIHLATGQSIVSGADWGGGRVELSPQPALDRHLRFARRLGVVQSLELGEDGPPVA